MHIHTRIVAAIAVGLIFVSSAAIGSDAKPKPQSYSAAAENASCLTQTGSRICVKGKSRGTGRYYTSEDMRRTGATTVGRALALLDPSIIVYHSSLTEVHH
jgi:hypothetical protein